MALILVSSSEANDQPRTGARTMRYETPMGTFKTWEEAAEACERADFDPCDCIRILAGS